jgi:hypothetical protein
MAGPLPPERPTEALHSAQGFVSTPGAWAVRLPRLCVPARRNDRLGAPQGDGVAAGAPVLGAVGGDGRDRLALGDLRQQAGQHGRVADPAVGDLDGSNLPVRRGNGPPGRFLILLTLVDGQMNLALRALSAIGPRAMADAPTGPAMLAGVPFVGVPVPRTEP